MNIDLVTLEIIVSAFLLGWIIRSKKSAIIWYFRENWVPIVAISVWIITPLFAYAIFWINVYLWENNLIYGISIATILIISVSFFWILRRDKKNAQRNLSNLEEEKE